MVDNPELFRKNLEEFLEGYRNKPAGLSAFEEGFYQNKTIITAVALAEAELKKLNES